MLPVACGWCYITFARWRICDVQCFEMFSFEYRFMNDKFCYQLKPGVCVGESLNDHLCLRCICVADGGCCCGCCCTPDIFSVFQPLPTFVDLSTIIKFPPVFIFHRLYSLVYESLEQIVRLSVCKILRYFVIRFGFQLSL